MKTHREDKPHIGFFGRCNVGKSTIINLLTGQDTAIVSPLKGTTTDVVKKTMELFQVGAVTLIDTAGIDDESILAKERQRKTLEATTLVDMAVMVLSDNIFGESEMQLIQQFKQLHLPYVIVYNKQDIFPISQTTLYAIESTSAPYIITSNSQKNSKEQITSLIKANLPNTAYENKHILQGIIQSKDIVLLVTPIDSSAPKGRLILPQVKMIREVLDSYAICIVVQPSELDYVLNIKHILPKLVITDSQAFKEVDSMVPTNIHLTSFSILLAKEKGAFEDYLRGTPTLDNLQDGDKIIMLESCTHQPTCEDIGRVKLPKMIEKYSHKKLQFTILPGLTPITDDPKQYKLVIQCGGCVSTYQQIHSHLQPFIQAGVPITNYGMAIAYVNGIFNRACEIFFNNN